MSDLVPNQPPNLRTLETCFTCTHVRIEPGLTCGKYSIAVGENEVCDNYTEEGD